MQFRDFRKELARNGIKMLFFMNRILLEGKHKKTFETEIRISSEIDAPVDNSRREYQEAVSDITGETALAYYREQIEQHPQFEAMLIREWAKEDSESGRAVKFAIEERIAMQEAESLQSDERTAILSIIAES